ncbi:MAG: hypothetical protein ACK559_04755 [bacterium]
MASTRNGSETMRNRNPAAMMPSTPIARSRQTRLMALPAALPEQRQSPPENQPVGDGQRPGRGSGQACRRGDWWRSAIPARSA